MENPRRLIVYFEPDVHEALRLQAAASCRSISDLVNDAVRIRFAEDDASDLDAFSARRREKNVTFNSFVSNLRRRGKARAAG
jgi:hypothetical protein